jgi:hypothetical protein
LALSDYYLFPNLKKHLKGRKFPSIEEATLGADGWFAAQPKEFFMDVLKKLERRSHKCVELRGEYVNTFFNPVACFFFIKPKTYQPPLPRISLSKCIKT